MLDTFYNWFWNPSFWLPPNITWNDIEMKLDNTDAGYASPRHLWYSWFFLAFLWICKVNLDRLIFRPFGSYLEISNCKPIRFLIICDPDNYYYYYYSALYPR